MVAMRLEREIAEIRFLGQKPLPMFRHLSLP
jgi:hypothetical protein